MVAGFSSNGGSNLMPVNMNSVNNHSQQQQILYGSPLAGILPDPASQIPASRRPDLIGKRSFTGFQQQQIQNQHGVYHRSVKSRTNYQHASPISPLSPVDFSLISTVSSDVLPFSPDSNSPASNLMPAEVLMPNSVKTPAPMAPELEKKMINHRLLELEKQLMEDEDEESVSLLINSEWSETIQGPILTCSTSSPTLASPKQSLIEAAVEISDGNFGVAAEILTRLQPVANSKSTPEERLTAYIFSALKSRLNPAASMPELHSQEYIIATQKLHDVSPCFKLGFMAANLAILEATSDLDFNKLHVVDFDIGRGGQYVHLLHMMAAKKVDNKAGFLKITTFSGSVSGTGQQLKTVGEGLKELAGNFGIFLSFRIMNLNMNELSREELGVESDEALAVNLAFKLYKLPDESVTTENLRDKLLRRVKGLSPEVVALVEQEMNANTASLVSRVKEVCDYYIPLFDSLDATMQSHNPQRVKIEDALGQRICNSVACEGRDRVERCELFGKWRARLSIAGFHFKPMSQLVASSVRSKLDSSTCANLGFTVMEQSGCICFGWKAQTLTVASAWH